MVEFLTGLYSCDVHQMAYGLIDSWLFSVSRQKAFAAYAQCTTKPKSKIHMMKYRNKCDKTVISKCHARFTNNTHPCSKALTSIRSVLKSIGEKEFGEHSTVAPGNLSYEGTILDVTNKEVLSEFGRCYASHYRQTAACSTELKQACEKSTFISAKTIRLRGKTLLKVLEKDKDLKVVYFVRDPRAIIMSRRSTGGVTSMSGRGNYATEADLLCKMMADDYNNLMSVAHKYGHRIYVDTYESLILDSDSFVRKLYQFLEVPLPNATKQWVHRLTHKRAGTVGKESAFGTFRVDPKKTAFKWKSNIPEKMNADILKVCKDTLKLLKYEA